METSFRSLSAVDCETKPYMSAAADPSRRGGLDHAHPALNLVPRDWTELLKRTIEAEIIPHLLSARPRCDAVTKPESRRLSQADVAAFVDLIIADDMDRVRAVADRVIVRAGGRDALLHELLAPAADLLGEMWVQDVCDFTTVTLGVYRLDQIMKETATVQPDDYVPVTHDRTILLLPSPGEQHSFGLNMVADMFRENGWCVRAGPAVARAKLVELVAGEWFDLIGLSVTAERALKGLPACIREVRQASCNPDLGVFAGGRAIREHGERSRFLGADSVLNDPRQALIRANDFVDARVTERLHQSKTNLVDIG